MLLYLVLKTIKDVGLFCLSLPVDKDFNIIFDKASIVPENKKTVYIV